jgi:hypothetical protein
MSFISKNALLATFDTADPRWVDWVLSELMEGEAVVVTDGPRLVVIPGGRIDGPVWQHAYRHLREAGIEPPDVPTRELSEYDFGQMLAEAAQRFGRERIERYLIEATRRFGWPIPPEMRERALVHVLASALGLPQKGGAA